MSQDFADRCQPFPYRCRLQYSPREWQRDTENTGSPCSRSGVQVSITYFRKYEKKYKSVLWLDVKIWCDWNYCFTVTVCLFIYLFYLFYIAGWLWRLCLTMELSTSSNTQPDSSFSFTSHNIHIKQSAAVILNNS